MAESAETAGIPSASTPPEIPISEVPRTPSLALAGWMGVIRVVAKSPEAWWEGVTTRQSALFDTYYDALRWVEEEEDGWPRSLYVVQMAQVQPVYKPQ